MATDNQRCFDSPQEVLEELDSYDRWYVRRRAFGHAPSVVVDKTGYGAFAVKIRGYDRDDEHYGIFDSEAQAHLAAGNIRKVISMVRCVADSDLDSHVRLTRKYGQSGFRHLIEVVAGRM